jgi:hypothetical protein
MNVTIEEYTTQSDIKNKKVKFSGLTLEQESALSKVLSIMLFESVSKALSEDGTQSLILTYNPNNFIFYTSPYLKIYEPFNTNLPESLSKRLTELFENQKV